jgi:hypothetical protein
MRRKFNFVRSAAQGGGAGVDGHIRIAQIDHVDIIETSYVRIPRSFQHIPPEGNMLCSVKPVMIHGVLDRFGQCRGMPEYLFSGHNQR